MNDISKLNFYHYEYIFSSTNDELSLQELYLLKEKCPNFDFSYYKPGVFTLQNIKKFSESFLLNNYQMLNESILELSKTKVIFLLEHPRLLRFGITSLRKLSLEELSKIDDIDDIDSFMLFEELSKAGGFKKLLPLLFVKFEVIKFISKNFEYVFSDKLRSDVIRFLKDNESENAIMHFQKHYITSLTSLDEFINNYFSCKNVYKALNTDVFSDLLINNHVLKLKLDKSNYNDYFNLKYKKVTLLLSNNVDENKELISKLYFNINYEILKESLICAKKCKLFENYTLLLDIDNNEDLLKFLSTIKNKTNIYYEIYEKLFPITKENIVASFKCDSTILEGEEFGFLIHTLTGYESKDKVLSFASDPSLWNNTPRTDSYISTSYISDKFMGMSESKSYVLGFINLSKDSIIYAASRDLYSSRKQLRNNIRNGNSSCILSEQLRFYPKMMYNEVTLRSLKNGVVLSPDFILSLDYVSGIDMEASKYFKAPIYLLNRMAYARKMNDDLNRCLAHDDLDNYLDVLKRMFLSFMNNERIISEYFSESKLEKRTLELIKKYASSVDTDILKKLEEIVNLYSSLVYAYNFNKDANIEYDIKRYVNMLKKY